MTATSRAEDDFVRILAPLGRDAELACQALRSRGMSADICADVDAACDAIRRGAGAVLLTQEALSLPNFERLLHVVEEQPPWSDLPLVVLVSGGTPTSALTRALMALDRRSNSTILERPVRVATIVRAVESALRTRGRQYELREHLVARERAEEAERLARSQAEDAARARDEFLSIASHELRNPVAAISGAAQLIRRSQTRGSLSPERLETYIQTIEDRSAHLARLTEDLLDVSRLQRGRMPLRLEPVDLTALVAQVLASSGLEGATAMDAPEPLPIVAIVDPDRIRQILDNVLDNARKYAPDGPVEAHVRRDGDGVLVEVRDSGIGLPAGWEERIFTPFGRAENAQQANVPGLGLGLYICRKIAEEHGGRLWATSPGEQRGTTVSLWLPCEGPEPEAARSSRA